METHLLVVHEGQRKLASCQMTAGSLISALAQGATKIGCRLGQKDVAIEPQHLLMWGDPDELQSLVECPTPVPVHV